MDLLDGAYWGQEEWKKNGNFGIPALAHVYALLCLGLVQNFGFGGLGESTQMFEGVGLGI